MSQQCSNAAPRVRGMQGTQLYVLAVTVALAACGGDGTDGEALTNGPSVYTSGGATTGPDGGTQPTTGTTGTSTTGSTSTTSGITGTTGSTGGITSTGSNGTTTNGTTAGTTSGGSTTGTTAGAGTTGPMADGGTMMGDSGGGPVTGGAEPEIPEVTGECPTFSSGSFSFMDISGEMEVGSKDSGPGPLLFYWHGTGGSAGGFNSPFGGIGSQNVNKITSMGGIIFAVQGSTGSGDSTCSGTAVFDGDFSTIDQVVACAVRDHNIDPRRIYATGCSAGGLQSGCMSVRRSQYMAAVAPNSGGLVGAFGASFDNAAGHVPATMSMHGGDGDNVIINFGDSSRTFNNAVSGAGGMAIDCNHGSGHCGAPSDLYTAAIDFLLAHPFGIETSPYESGLPSGVPEYCMIVQ